MCAGFSGEEREVLKEWVLRLGAQYSGDLVCRKSTHLVYNDLLALTATTKFPIGRYYESNDLMLYALRRLAFQL